jgi:hypothetical protein
MGNRVEGDKAPDPEPWKNDDSLNNYRHMDTINKVVGLIQELAEIMEKEAIGSNQLVRRNRVPNLQGTKEGFVQYRRHHTFSSCQ